MRKIARWLAVVFIAMVAVSPVFEVFDKTDGLAQDSFDFARYVICLFCFLVFALRRTVVTLRLTSFRKKIIGPVLPAAVEGHVSRIFRPAMNDRGLFLTFHDFRI